ncbi:hypothetical protein B0T10DRAFT_464321 [Thelonectria olida]|uniref:Zn(2)-C6 fungal-type domain-containing protein n=1 Tax=Thelonectria olida TaxID=1576542 RepID=A0A9P8VUJ4_9HYPO|nr:hypothetical protein B0T10DRAFT_464321 [Thelonectria olida]
MAGYLYLPSIRADGACPPFGFDQQHISQHPLQPCHQIPAALPDSQIRRLPPKLRGEMAVTNHQSVHQESYSWYRYGDVPRKEYPDLHSARGRQRASVACTYCRKRKIRCSDYQMNSKCTNCKRFNKECTFQPVSSSGPTFTAFVPVSAVPGGVPPGIQLFGAFGEPFSKDTNLAFAGVPSHQSPTTLPQPTAPYYIQRTVNEPNKVSSPYRPVRDGDGRHAAKGRYRKNLERQVASQDHYCRPLVRFPKDSNRGSLPQLPPSDGRQNPGSPAQKTTSLAVARTTPPPLQEYVRHIETQLEVVEAELRPIELGSTPHRKPGDVMSIASIAM